MILVDDLDKASSGRQEDQLTNHIITCTFRTSAKSNSFTAHATTKMSLLLNLIRDGKRNYCSIADVRVGVSLMAEATRSQI